MPDPNVQIEERRGNRENAVVYYSRFVEHWKDCEPELQHALKGAQARLAVLRTEAAGSRR